MYLLLTGAKKNSGDFLITERATQLLKEAHPGQELRTAPAWQPLDLDLANSADAVVILGGPGYQPNLYPKVYPLAEPLSLLKTPLFLMGMGWKGIPGDEATVAGYRFADSSLAALKTISQRTQWLGCRDTLTLQVLQQQGFDNALMTGCPVWYHLPSIGKPMRLPEQVRRLVFTPAQHARFQEQSVAVLGLLADTFPDAERICAFHRGIDEPSAWTTEAERAHHRYLANSATTAGYRVENVSGALETTDFYDRCDFHVGYRVHAHIQFLSQRLPSLLIHEDGRGRGASEALELRGVDAFVRTNAGRVREWLPQRGPLSRARRVAQRLGPDYVADPDVPARVRRMLRLDLDTGFARYAGVGARIDRHLPVMQRFLRSLPS